MPPQPIEQDLAVNAHAPVEPASSVSNFPKKRRCFRRWAFRLLAVALSLHSLLLFEGLLRLCGVGHDVRLIVPADIDGTKLASFQFNPFVDLAYYGVADLSGPEPRHFVLPKPPSTLRILVIGGSTVIGFPYPPELAFPRHLEVLLKSQQLGREVEVLNAGITAVNSAIEVEVAPASGQDTQPPVPVLSRERSARARARARARAQQLQQHSSCAAYRYTDEARLQRSGMAQRRADLDSGQL